MKTIAILGMGLSGNASFCRLIQMLETIESEYNGITILIFEQNPQHIATGFAYSTDSPEIWTLNNPANQFKFIPGCESLIEWITTNQDFVQTHYPNADKDYIPRALVGHYLKFQYEKQKSKALSMGIKIEEIFDTILDINYPAADSYQIISSTRTYDADTVFLTTGHLMHDYFQSVDGENGFYRLDRGLNQFESLDTTKEIYIIGGQAAFVDAALWLTLCKNYKGKIHTVTRTQPILTTKGNSDGCCSTAQEALSRTLKTQQSEDLSFENAKQLFWDAYLQDAKEPVNPQNLSKTHLALRYQMDKFDKHSQTNPDTGNIDELRAFVKTFYFSNCYEYMWQSLSEGGKEQFLMHFYSLLMACLTGITPINARIMLHLYEQDCIIEHQGLVSISYDYQSRQFQLLFASGDIHYTSAVIDTTGYRYKPNQSAVHPGLLDKLAQKGILSPRPYGGLLLTDKYQVIDEKGDIHLNLFCIGPVASYGHPVPIPHSSFMVYRDVELVVKNIESTFLSQKGILMKLTSENSYYEISSRLTKLTTPLICDAFPDVRLMNSAIHSVGSEEQKIAIGRAYTVHSAQDSLSTMQALDDLPDFVLSLGCADDRVPILLVIAACGTNLAVAGGMCADVAKTKGFGGIVTDGNCRDIDEIKRTNIPFFARGQHAKSGSKDKIGNIRQPINCGDVLVNPGDLVFADKDGIVVMDKDEAILAVNKAEEIMEKEERALARIHEGARFDEICNLQEHMKHIEAGEPSTLKLTV